MFLKANPAKARSEADKKGISKAYDGAESVLPLIVSSPDSVADDEDRRLLQEVRELSLREVQSDDHSTRRADASTEASTENATSRRRPHEAARRAATNRDTVPPHQTTAVRRTQIEHQSSLRSLISSSDADTSEMEEEIMRQIAEEGLLDGIDLSAIDVSQEDEISERIAAAFRRRQRERGRTGGRRRSDSGRTHPSLNPQSDNRSDVAHTRSRSAVTETQQSLTSSSLTTTQGRARARRVSDDPPRDGSPVRNGRTDGSATSALETGRRATSSQVQQRPKVSGSQPRRTTEPAGTLTGNRPAQRPTQRSAELSKTLPASSHLSPHASPGASPHLDTSKSRDGRSIPASSSHSPSRGRASLYPEPSVSCERCGRRKIEYQLHYFCSKCKDGTYSLCSSCYRQGRGCLHWYGFGYAAWDKYERQAPADGYPANHSLPHTLTGRRYLRPKQVPTQSTHGDGVRHLLTTEDPLKRRQVGNFCSVCERFANTCYWRCGTCNEGEWGFCNNCVNTGKHCTHPLLPLMNIINPESGPPTRAMITAAEAQLPASMSILRDPGIIDHGSMKPLSVTTSCAVCHLPIQPSSTRFHCHTCNDGDYDICTPCYLKASVSGRISAINNAKGWRRCFRGHRMVVIGFEDRDGGRKRIVVRDLVGGLALRDEGPQSATKEIAADASGSPNPVTKWSWKDHPDGERETRTIPFISATTTGAADTTSSLPSQLRLPPDGGVGQRLLAIYSWSPEEGAENELTFPRGAEIREAEDINGDWFWGCYAGAKGLFPGPYVRRLDGSPLAG
ncbi:MAG: hypothetical protein M1825_004300 [Sarcosagium campestre]|nr:MAG: hypothetical protein M1825_004300 [Sarcosagium campestre]